MPATVVGFAAEVIGTAILVFTVFGAAVDGRAPAGFAGIVIGFIVYGIIILVGPITGAALNPARQIGPEHPRRPHRRQDATSTSCGSTSPARSSAASVGAFLYEFVGHVRTATVPGAAVAEAAHADA